MFEKLFKSKEQNYIKNFKRNCIEITNNKNTFDVLIEKSKNIIYDLNPENKNERNALLYGQVQSGKTLNFLAFICQAFQEDFNLTIVFTGLDNLLKNQTLDRIKDSFGLNENGDYSEICIFDIKNIISDSDLGIRKLDEILKKNKKVIIVSIKNKSVFDSLKILQEKLLNKYKVLIIDDEADIATYSINRKEEKSITHWKLGELVFNFDRAIYLCITATPYAIFFTKNSDKLFPYKAYIIEPGLSYIGFDFFVKNKEKNLFLIKNKELDKYSKTSEITEHVLKFLLISCEMFEFRNKEKLEEIQQTSMLCHFNVRQDSHETVKIEISEFINNLNDILIEEKKNDISFEKNLNLIKKIILECNLINCIDSFNENKTKFLIDFNTHVLSQVNIKVINNKTKNDDIKDINRFNIYIGSKMLERGITIKNLLYTIFTNRNKSISTIDTTLQRARWFGYREEIASWMRIYLEEELYNDFINIYEVDNELRNKISDSQINKQTFASISKTLKKVSQKLIPTNKVPIITDNIKNKKLKFYNDPWNYNEEELIPIKNKIIDSNESITIGKKTFKCINYNDFKTMKEEINVISDDDFLSYFGEDAGYYSEYILKHLKNKKIIIALMEEDEKPRRRSINNNSFTLSQGRSEDNGITYIGDDYWYNDPNIGSEYFIFQLHNIDFEKDKEVKFNKLIFSMLLNNSLKEEINSFKEFKWIAKEMR
ncbi:MAG: Z1 domain-containing protein [Metamycoplasmataceae bacterium]